MKKFFTQVALSLLAFSFLHSQTAPVMAPIQGPSAVCAQPSGAATFTANASNSPSLYFWSCTGNSGVVMTNTNTSITSISFPNLISGTTYTLSCYAMNGFGASNTVSFVVTVNETPNVTFSGANTFCQGSATKTQPQINHI